jgi:hypothetical protein
LRELPDPADDAAWDREALNLLLINPGHFAGLTRIAIGQIISVEGLVVLGFGNYYWSYGVERQMLRLAGRALHAAVKSLNKELNHE